MVKPRTPEPEPEVADEISMSLEDLAVAIEKMSDLGERINKSRLSERALILLIKDSCAQNLSMSQIRAVLDVLPDLKDRYLKEIETRKKK